MKNLLQAYRIKKEAEIGLREARWERVKAELEAHEAGLERKWRGKQLRKRLLRKNRLRFIK